MLYKSLLKPILFRFQAEKAHHLTTSLFKFVLALPVISSVLKARFRIEDNRLNKKVMGLEFKNPVGLAAGFDKDGKYYADMEALGFGFIEIGTVTPLAQKGNPQPRLFRLPADKALINRMGFNNEGVDAMVRRLKNRKSGKVIIGGNIGKNKVTPNSEATADYTTSFQKLYPLVDYFVVNVSSPNTPGLRELQDKEPLTRLLQELADMREQMSMSKPILLKVAPDLTLEQLSEVLEVIDSVKLDGIILANTTINRADLKTSEARITKIGNGGLSGAPLIDRTAELIRYVRADYPRLVIIGVGGITQPQHARKLLDAGADLIQVYSGLVYYGPYLVKDINKLLVQNT